MEDDTRFWDPDTKGLSALIDTIYGVHCIGVWKDVLTECYHCIVKTERQDKERVVCEIIEMTRSRKGIEIADSHVYFINNIHDMEMYSARLGYITHNVGGHEARYHVDVTLKFMGNEMTGHSEGALARTNRLRIAAEATIDAVKKLIPGSYELPINGVKEVEVDGETIIFCLITLVGHGMKHCGTALNRADDIQTAIRATLDAVNRYIEMVTQKGNSPL